jgi:hypothetical protein
MQPSELQFPERRRRVRVILLLVAVFAALLIIMFLNRRRVDLSSEMAPGSMAALRRALGDDAGERITQVISAGNRPSTVSASTHLRSGWVHGRPYGLAFDLAIVDGEKADDDVRRLRLQGIAAWRRGPGAPGGGESLSPHIHCVWPGAPTENSDNREQVSSFVHGFRGLVGVGPPREWRDPSIRADERIRVKAAYERINGRRSLDHVVPYEQKHRRPRN